jgi:hypothetical protein
MAGEPEMGSATAGGMHGGQPIPGETGLGHVSAAPSPAGSNDVVMGTLACLLGPALHKEAGRMDEASASGASPAPGFTPASCAAAAKAADVKPGALANREPNAIDAARRALESRLSAEGPSSEVAGNKLAFFDKGVEAAKEAAVADQVVYGHRTERAVSASDADAIRAHRALDELDRFGKNLGASAMGIEAQALGWIIAAHRFMAIGEVPASKKSLVAEPLFAVGFRVSVPAVRGRSLSSWSAYVAAAAQAVGATPTVKTRTGRAVGGGPSSETDENNLKEVVRTARGRLEVLAEQLRSGSDLRTEVENVVARLRELGPDTDASPG